MIRPDTEAGLLLPACAVPDGMTVTKLTGQARYVLRHKLTLFQNQDPKTTVKPVEIEGTFLVGTRGDISQISPNLMLLWRSTAGEIADLLEQEFAEAEIPQ